MMKKLWIAALLGLMLALSGCGGEKAEDAEEDAAVEEGQYKIEIFTAESTAVPVNTTEDPTVIQKLLESPEWERITEVPGDLVPEFGLRIWKKSRGKL
mgnify:FL=1